MDIKKVIAETERIWPSVQEDLKALVRIPSISAENYPAENVKKSAEATAKLLKNYGFQNVEILTIPNTHPYVYGDFLHDPSLPTVLLYAHHDVQPPGDVQKWVSPPFEPQERNGRLYGRGSADDKAGILVHAAALRAYLQAGEKPNLNLKILVEGEEETGSENLETFLNTYRARFDADILILTDTGNFDTGIPTLTTSLRGLVAVEVEVSSLKQSVHSGMWGGPVADPVLGLSKMLATLVDADGKIAIPGIWEKVRPLSQTEQKSIDQLKYTTERLHKESGLLAGVDKIGTDSNPLVQMSREPSLAINAIQASSKKEVSNIINASAWCKVGIRTVPDMDAKETLKLLKDHLEKNVPWGLQVKFSNEGTADWWVTEPKGQAFDHAVHALEKAYGRPAVFLGCGGTIPFVHPFSKVLNGPPFLLVGVEDPYTNAHSENESLHLEDFRKAILAACFLYQELRR